MTEKSKVPKEIKILFIEILKAGEITNQQAHTIDTFFKNTQLMNEIKITFK